VHADHGRRGPARARLQPRPDLLVEHFCRALVTRRDHIPWDIGGVHQPPLPLERMVRESPATPQDVPMHPGAAAVWQQHGYLP
jgi:hypothetical protein